MLATLAFTLFLSEIGGNPAMASTTSVVLVTTAMLLILLQRWVVARRNYATDAINRPEILPLHGWQKLGLPGLRLGGDDHRQRAALAIIVYTSFLETSGPVFLEPASRSTATARSSIWSVAPSSTASSSLALRWR